MAEELELVEKMSDDLRNLTNLLSSDKNKGDHNINVVKLVKNDLENAIEHLQLLVETEENIVQVKKIKCDHMTYLRYIMIQYFYFNKTTER